MSIAWWWWAGGAGLIAVVVLAILLSGGGDDEGDSAPAGTDGEAAATSTATDSSSGGGSTAATGPADTGGDATNGEAPPSVEGIWEFIVSVTATSGVCAGEEDEAPGIDNVRIWQRSDGTYAVAGLGSTAEDEWDGHWEDGDFVFSGERDEDGGTTVAAFRMHFTDDGALIGDEDWSWSDNDGDCPTGASEVEAYYYGPLQ